ncbi:hypothetical protein TorRG33x02_338710 [Trema orientale]|uniref:Uncharacterized protein n=1 Tax=Trema orientale TaxID=63057 RepID=A0A2P5AXF0_TREOI|nr:hypothetical protein TorRG33x02_338710 [Trema orientale]
MRQESNKSDEGSNVEKSLETAVVIFKQRSQISWKAIKQSLERITGISMKVILFAADRLVSWLVNNEEKRYILKEKILYNGRVLLGSIDSWDKVLHWEYIKIEARLSWIGIEGLPLNLQNMDTFQKIGEAYEGLLEVTEDTLQKSL